MMGLGLALAALVVLAAPVLAVAGEISGLVVDTSGAVLPGASVSVSAPGVARSAQTQPDGRFTVPRLPAGTYKVTVALSVFAPATREGVVVVEAPVDVTTPRWGST